MMGKTLCGVEDEFPEDLWLYILSKLPVKSVLCCRCVCKTWHRFITTTSFIETHIAYQNSSSNKYTFYDSDDKLTLYRDFEFPFDNDDTKHSKIYYTRQSFAAADSILRVEGICNGLFCLRASNDIYLWNPICRKVKKLPQLINRVYGMGVSFGYYDDDYKVIVISLRVKTYPVSVYSLKTNSWKIITSVPQLVPELYVRFTSFVHDTVYMLTLNEFGEFKYSVMCFSLSDETIRVINFPELGIINMEVYEDTIAVLQSCSRLDSHYLDMWILRSKSSASTSPWEKKFSIKLQEGDGDRSFIIPVGFLNNGKYLVRTVVFAEDFCSWVDRLSWCDLESPKLTEFKSHMLLVQQHGRRIVPDIHARIRSDCVESLLLLNDDSLEPFVHNEMEATCSSMLFTLHPWCEPSSTQQR